MEMFQKRSCKLMFKIGGYFRNIEVIQFLLIKSVADMESYTPQFQHKNNQNLQLNLQNGSGCTHVTSSAASRYSAVKLTTGV